MTSKIEKIKLEYNGKQVIGRRLTISSEIPIPLETAWKAVQRISLLQFITKGRIIFKPVAGSFPEFWRQGIVLQARMMFYGFFPLGGVHTIQVIELDNEKHKIVTQEKDNMAKIWNHTIFMQELELGKKVKYTDEIEIYGGWLTGLITFWAKYFYQYRQKRWVLVANNF